MALYFSEVRRIPFRHNVPQNGTWCRHPNEEGKKSDIIPVVSSCNHMVKSSACEYIQFFSMVQQTTKKNQKEQNSTYGSRHFCTPTRHY